MIAEVQYVAVSFVGEPVAIMQFVLNPRGVPDSLIGYDRETGRREASDEAIQAEVDKTFYNRTVVGWTRINREDVPIDRSYRDAWTHDGKKFGHDMRKARDLHRQALRDVRVSELADLDVEYNKADENGDAESKKKVAVRKQMLRDLPAHPLIEQAGTVDELKRLTMDYLGRERRTR